MKIILGTMEFGRAANEKLSKEMSDLFLESGTNTEIDTAFMYSGGKSEEILGRLGYGKGSHPKAALATKANPWSAQGLQGDRVKEQLNISLKRLQVDCVDLFYLHAPDHKTPIEETLAACYDLFREKKFKRFGLSNYAAWQVVQIYYICKEKGYMLPEVYQGMYNPITRVVETDLFPALKELNIAFYAYNPLAGGLLTGKYAFDDKESKPKGRFFGNSWDKIYQERFWHECNFKAIDIVRQSLQEEYNGAVTLAEASLRWLAHHSKMVDGQSGIILGASKLPHLVENLKGCSSGPLSDKVVQAFEKAWQIAKQNCPTYFR